MAQKKKGYRQRIRALKVREALAKFRCTLPEYHDLKGWDPKVPVPEAIAVEVRATRLFVLANIRGEKAGILLRMKGSPNARRKAQRRRRRLGISLSSGAAEGK